MSIKCFYLLTEKDLFGDVINMRTADSFTGKFFNM